MRLFIAIVVLIISMAGGGLYIVYGTKNYMKRLEKYREKRKNGIFDEF